jgi:hypothetical protein
LLLAFPLSAFVQDIFYINFGAWHRKNSADWANFAPALEALGRDYQQHKDRWPHLLFRENAAIHLKNLAAKTCGPITGACVTKRGGARVEDLPLLVE